MAWVVAEDFQPITGVMAGRKIVLDYIKLLRDRDIEMPAQAWRVGAGHFSGNYAAPQVEYV